MRTLLVSDLHLGQRGGGVSVLERPAPLATLLSALEDYDRLVLLGDTVELQEAHSAHSLPVAELILRRIAEQLGPDRQLVLVPGNHDHELVREWAQAQGPGLARENLVPLDSSPLLTEVVSWLADTRVEVRYPGLWLADGVWAAHGHQLNHYMRPVSSWGLHTRRSERPETPAAFEYIPSRDEVEHMRDGLPPERAVDNLIPKRLAPLTAYALDRQMQRHAGRGALPGHVADGRRVGGARPPAQPLPAARLLLGPAHAQE